MPEGAKACGDHLLIRDRAREQAQPEGEAIQGGDGVDPPISQSSHGPRCRGEELDVRL